MEACAALWSGVEPLLLCASTWAPFSMRSLTINREHQWGHTVAILCVYLGTIFDEQLDVFGSDGAFCREDQWSVAVFIACIDLCAVAEQQLGIFEWPLAHFLGLRVIGHSDLCCRRSSEESRRLKNVTT